MKHYIELTLIANTDINAFSLWSKLYQQLHLALVEMQDQHQRVPIGLSFPEYRMNEKYGVLGCKCRLFASEPVTLERLNLAQWLVRLSDYVHCTSIKAVPEKVTGYAVYRRERRKTNPERLARRYARRHNMDLETALTTPIEPIFPAGETRSLTTFRYADMAVPSVVLPFIRLQSLSGGQTFCLWIGKIEALAPVAGSFSAYGLSGVATVPEF